jgi:hypothetical protein
LPRPTRGTTRRAVAIGQYHYVVNLDRREFLHPHQLGDGLKLMEFANSIGGTTTALCILLARSNGRGGGDLHYDSTWIGAWGNNRITIIGDYTVPDDVPGFTDRHVGGEGPDIVDTPWGLDENLIVCSKDEEACDLPAIEFPKWRNISKPMQRVIEGDGMFAFGDRGGWETRMSTDEVRRGATLEVRTEELLALLSGQTLPESRVEQYKRMADWANQRRADVVAMRPDLVISAE